MMRVLPILCIFMIHLQNSDIEDRGHIVDACDIYLLI